MESVGMNHPACDLIPFGDFYRGKRVLVTGHTGFKGSWLCEWLLLLGAEVHGYALRPPSSPALFETLGLSKRLVHVEGDIRSQAALRAAIAEARPDVIFHLAAQPLVRASYLAPIDTFSVNVIGTAEVIEAARTLATPCSVICITTDKCYENREWHYGYRESDALGGHDPYSASKAAAEIVIASLRNSFCSTPDTVTRIASARAGNVIGGGDWAVDRIFPDCMRALAAGAEIVVRNPKSVRPWQHVLEPLSGYLVLAWQLHEAHGDAVSEFAAAFNFGPNAEAQQSVSRLVDEIVRYWPGKWKTATEHHAPHEAGRLALSIEKASALLSWRPVWNFAEGVEHSVDWYRLHAVDPNHMGSFTRNQIKDYQQAAYSRGIAWSGAGNGYRSHVG